MSRLIEADAVYKILESCEIKKDTYGSLLNDWDHGYNCGIERAESEIECAPTVEAIPVEWIRKYTEENRLYQSDDFDLYISDMIADWTEEKKDIRRCGICKHFLGGGDFGTCCDQTYELKYRDSKVCEKYSERK